MSSGKDSPEEIQDPVMQITVIEVIFRNDGFIASGSRTGEG